jgi:FSR family fosmidomycin resistance protein-like MFS transporter
MISQLSGDKKGMGMSFYMTGGELARTLGPLVAVGAVTIFGLEGFYPIMIFGVLASVWLHQRFREVPVHKNNTARTPMLSTFYEMRHILLPLTAILIARAFMHASMTTFLPTFVQQETGNLWLAGFALTALEGIGVVAVLSSGTLSDHIGRKRILFIALVGAPIGLFLFVLTSGPLRFLMLLVTGFTLLSTTPVMLAMVQENAQNSPSVANGLFMMASFVVRSIIGVVVGMIADRIGLYATYIISAGIGLLGIPFIMMLPHKKQ